MNIEKQWMLNYLGERFKFFRKEKELSRDEASKLIGVSSRTLAAYERGEREITIDTTEKMAAVYGVTFEQLTDYKYVYKKMKDYIENGENRLEGAVL